MDSNTRASVIRLLKRSYEEGYQSGYNAGHIDAGDDSKKEIADPWDDDYASDQLNDVLAQPANFCTCDDDAETCQIHGTDPY
jgi:hypothetical protein